MADGLASILTGLGLGLALAGAPGPVQAVLLTEGVKGGLKAGLKAFAGANVTFGLLVIGLASGLLVVTPKAGLVRILRIVGGGFLLLLAADGLRSAAHPVGPPEGISASPSALRGALAVLLNPGAWIFLGLVASPLLAAASRQGGQPAALFTALGLAIGLATGDLTIVLVGSLGVRRASAHVGTWIRRGLSILLGALALSLVVTGVR